MHKTTNCNLTAPMYILKEQGKKYVILKLINTRLSTT